MTSVAVERQQPSCATRHYELRASFRGPEDTLLEVWQVPSKATPQVKVPVRVAGLRGRNLAVIEHRVLRRLKQSGITIAGLALADVRTFSIDEDLALNLGLLFRMLAPMRSLENMRACAEGIEAMGREEAAYWLGMAIPPGAVRPARAADGGEGVIAQGRTNRRLIEDWLPIAEIGIESTRGVDARKPPSNRLHVWWARRPLVASRAAVLASLLPADADRKKFLHVLGIHGDPVAAKKRIAIADRKGERLAANAYGYPRAFSYTPDDADRFWLAQSLDGRRPRVLGPTAGGGSIPFEATRLGIDAVSNDLNPVASLSSAPPSIGRSTTAPKCSTSSIVSAPSSPASATDWRGRIRKKAAPICAPTDISGREP